MLSLSNPWVILAAVVTFGAITGGIGYKSYKLGQDSVIARQAKDEQVRMETLQLAQQGAAEEIARIQIVNKTIYAKATHEVIEKPVYRDCVHSLDGMRAINEALTNGAQPIGDSSVSGANTARW